MRYRQRAGARFGRECGTGLAAPSLVAAAREVPSAERRLVTVLFADLVGFTTLSESRASETTARHFVPAS